MDELALLAAADRRALEYTRSLHARRVFPDAEAIAGLKRFDEPLPLDGYPPEQTLAKAAGSWVHVDGAFGLWARASSLNELTSGVELADSWTTDAHKWLNTPYDCAMAICRHASALSATLRGDADYSAAAEDAQKNLTLEFSRRPRGIPVWAALRSLGRTGVAEMVERHCRLAKRVAEGLSSSGYRVLNRVVLNQVLFRTDDQPQTLRIRDAVQASGETWFAATQWQGQPALRISISSWRTEDANIDRLLLLLDRIKRSDVME